MTSVPSWNHQDPSDTTDCATKKKSKFSMQPKNSVSKRRLDFSKIICNYLCMTVSIIDILCVTLLVGLLNFSYVVIFDYHGKENWHVSDPHNLFQKSSNMINCLKYEYSVFFNSVKKHQKHLINWLATHVPFPIFGWSLTCHCIISLALN